MSALHLKGEILASMNKQEEALSCFTQALNVDPLFWKAYLSRGKLYHEMNHTKDALHNYDRALKFDPSNREAHYNKARILFETKKYQRNGKILSNRYEEALQEFGECIKYHPEYDLAYHNMVRRKEIHVNMCLLV